MLEQFVVLQIPSALTKYVVVTLGVNAGEVPEPAYMPPHEPEYHVQEAPEPSIPPTTERYVEEYGQILLLPEIEVAGLEYILTVT